MRIRHMLKEAIGSWVSQWWESWKRATNSHHLSTDYMTGIVKYDNAYNKYCYHSFRDEKSEALCLDGLSKVAHPTGVESLDDSWSYLISKPEP